MMEDNKISVIVPAYNIENELARSLDSVLRQTYRNIEIIVVDDGSTDKTPEVIREYAQKHSNIIAIHQENRGAFCARFAGIQQATGDWIGFVDGDDEIEEDMYYVLIKNAIEYHADISHCGYQMVFPDRTDLYYGTDQIIQQDHLIGLKDLLSGTFVEPSLGNKLFRKILFIDLMDRQDLDVSIKINEDLLMNYYLFNKAKQSIFLDKCYYHYVMRKNSATTSKINSYKLEGPCKVLRILLKETDKEQELKEIVQSRYVRQLIQLSTMSLSVEPDLIRPYRANARKELRRGLKKYLFMASLGYKLKFMALWAGFFPMSYMMVHAAYLHITGLDKKYAIE